MYVVLFARSYRDQGQSDKKGGGGDRRTVCERFNYNTLAVLFLLGKRRYPHNSWQIIGLGSLHTVQCEADQASTINPLL